MRFRAPIIQQGLTRREATEAKERYLRINPGANVSIEVQPDNRQMFTLIAHLPVVPYDKVREPGFAGYRGWKAD